ncbi:MAG: enoyl-CoA hydratase/isomerase family protein [Hyphomicrobiales bacterium]|nr:enoyl-CoA hydratase/isomerase family protein [Hyphomicrobiales bacterium]
MSDDMLIRTVDSRGIATLTFNRPDKGNSYSPAMLDALSDALAELGADAAVRAIVLRGAGKHFSAGAEVGAPAGTGKPRTSIPGFCLALDAVPKPTVALVHGACIGGAVAMVACCDVVIATDGAFFSLPEVRLGFAPGPLIPFFLRAIDARSLRRFLMSGERFSAQEALRIGLVHELCGAAAVESSLARTLDELLLAGPTAAAHAKELLLRLARAPVTPELLSELQAELDQRFQSPEAIEGRASFREKRKPSWYQA